MFWIACPLWIVAAAALYLCFLATIYNNDHPV